VLTKSESWTARTAKPIDGDRHPFQLLVVDDDPVQRTIISRVAKRAGYPVTAARLVSEAIAQLHARAFDCVTLDLMLEDGDGVEVLTAMAKAKFNGAVILISGANAARRIAARSYARSLGIELHSLPKPVDLAALRICLANMRQVSFGLPVVDAWGGTAAEEGTEK
jgi:CheY-like chemotaxis protein